MACFFCRDSNVSLEVHDACKSPTAGIFAERTLCPKCGKCSKCDRPELIQQVRNQNYAILPISKRRYAIVRITEHVGLSLVDWRGKGQYLGPHLKTSYVEGCENLDYDAAHQRLADILYNPKSDYR